MALYRAAPKDGAAWVTGASMGLGAALARNLASRGYTVYASARSADKLAALAAESAETHGVSGRIVAMPLDVTDRKASRAAVEEIVTRSGSLALAVFNAGTFLPARAFKLDAETFDKAIALNFDGVINGLVPAIEKMNQAGRGQLALVSSSASYGGLPKSAAYGSTKAAISNLAASLKFDLDNMNIRIQVVTPGFIETPLTQKNDFAMPLLMPVERAAEALAAGLERGGFDITFPRRFTYLLKALNLLPYSLYFPIVAGFTGANRRKKK